MKIDKYVSVFNLGLQNTFVYRWNYFLRALFALIPLAGTVFLWRAIFKERGGGLQVRIDHRAIVVNVQPATPLCENGAPEKNGTRQRNQREKRAQEIIPAINKRVLQPKIKDADVLVDLHGAKIRLLMKAGAQEIQTLIRCSGGL